MNLKQFSNLIGITKPKPELNAPAVFNDELVFQQSGPKEVFLTWQAYARPEQSGFESNLTRTFIIIGIVVAFVLAILQEFFLIFVVASMIFVRYVLSKTPAELVVYELSSYGVTVNNITYYWSELKHFFFVDEKNGPSVVIDMYNRIPPRLFLTLGTAKKEKVKEIMSKYVLFNDKPQESFIDKTYTSLMGKLNS